MLDQVLHVFGIVPHHDLAVMTPARSLADVTARVVQRVSEVVTAERPAMVLVQGETRPRSRRVSPRFTSRSLRETSRPA
jgi:UDP-N-acetylglucosamine 2-epimerase (non-hydrolysing)